MKIRVNRYVSEIENMYDILEPNVINLVLAPTGSGKSYAFINNMKSEYNVAVCVPFVSLANQILFQNEDLDKKKGLKATEYTNYANGVITSFHSAPKLLEMHNIDLLVIDEIHYLIDYAAFSPHMINPFWDTINQLKKKFPNMKVAALTATPHFVRLANFLEFNIINIEQVNPTSKPDTIHVGSSWTNDYKKNQTFLAIVPSIKYGQAWAKKYDGIFLSSADKETKAFNEVTEGRMPNKKLFATTVLSTGISITDKVDAVYTNWLDLSTIVQSSSRPRQGGHKLFVTRTPNPYFIRNGLDEPALNFTNSYERNFKLIADYAQWYSWVAHQDETDLHSLIYQMLWAPDKMLPMLL